MLIFFICLFINIAASDFLTGVQSIDQIFFGTTVGIWLGFFCNAFIRRRLDSHLTRLFNGEYRTTGHGRLFINLTIIVLVDFIVCTSIYFIVKSRENNGKYQ